MESIKPTVGRNLYFQPSADFVAENKLTIIDSSPLHANLVFVNSDGVINIAGFDHIGTPYRAVNIPLVQDGEAPTEGESYAHWMTYQIQQADLAEKQ
jgi:hypothetical protein